MSSDNAETVKKSRELMDSGVDPIALMSQLASLIMDIIAGTYELTNLQSHDIPLGKRSREYIKSNYIRIIKIKLIAYFPYCSIICFDCC